MKIFSIIVCFNPKVDTLLNLCNKLTNNNFNIVLVDNSNDLMLFELIQSDNIHFIQLKENIGIAAAQNKGISYAMDKNADLFIFFDQDSEIEDDFLEELLSPLSLDIPMVTSPVFIDKKAGFQFPSYKLNKYGLLKQVKPINKLVYDVDVIISSGCATNRITLNIVGLMNEDYFIDFVDTEWSLRCLRQQVPLKVVPSAKMIHAIGDRSIDLKIIRLFIHSPIRSYYKLRNSFLFIRSPYVPLLFGLKEIASALIHNFIIIFLVKNKMQYFKNYYQAILDGIIGKTGKKSSKWK